MEIKYNKDEDYEYIKAFSKISVSSICKKLDYPKANILKGTASAERIHLVKKEIEKEIAKIYLIDNNE